MIVAILVGRVAFGFATEQVASRLVDAEATGGDVLGCPALPPHDRSWNDSMTFEPPSWGLARSDHVPRSDGRLLAAVGLGRQVLSWPPQLTHTVPETGITVIVHSESPIPVDTDELERLVTLPFDHLDAFTDPRLRALWSCYATRVLEDRELDGTQLRVYVPSDPTVCIRDYEFRMQDGRRCDVSGFALPAVRIHARMAGMPLMELDTAGSMLVAPGDAARRSSTFLHELAHHYDNLLGLPITVNHRDRYEQRAYYVQHRLLGAEDVRIPQPFG